MLVGHADIDGEPAVGVEPEHGSRQGRGRLGDLTPGAGRGAGGGGARMREMRLDLTPHARHLFADRVGELGLARGARALGFVRQDGERRLQPVREIPGPAPLRAGPPDRGGRAGG